MTIMPTVKKEQIRLHLKKLWTRADGCAVCGENSWEISEGEYELPCTSGGDPLKLAMVFCAKCGNSYLFSADSIQKSTPPLV